MRGAHIELIMELIGFNDLEMARRKRVRSDVDDVDAIAREAGHNEFVTATTRVVMATRACVPAQVMQLVADVGHRKAVDDLGVDNCDM